MPNSENASKFACEKCHFKCSKQSNFSKHISTNKHLILTNPIIQTTDAKKHKCDCGKLYKHASTLSTHKKKCKKLNNNIDIFKTDNEVDLKHLINKLIIENAEIKNTMLLQNNALQKQVIELCQSKSNSNNVINSNNKTFNLNFFLNEQCKDAMNITEFINSVTLNLQDLERVGSLGYVEGISSIIIKELRSLDIYKRPMHCSDIKREILYIKDKDKWEKEDPDSKNMKHVIKSVEHKNIKMIHEWTKEHPAYMGSNDVDNDKYLNIVLEAAGGTGNYVDKGAKIIKKIAKEVVIDKVI